MKYFNNSKEDTPSVLINLTKKEQTHPFLGRGEYITKIKYILNKKQKNNPLLIGSAGVGKTSIVHALSKNLKDETIYQLDLGMVISGTKYRG